MLDSSDIKRALRDAGFEVYRSKGSVVHVAERVRENLIMDAGVRVDGEHGLVAFYTRTQRRDFPGESDEQLYERARRLGDVALARGFREARAFVTDVPDPGDASLVLDRWYQMQFERGVASLDEAMAEVHFAFRLEKTARR
jgi:hypothetical protein